MKSKKLSDSTKQSKPTPSEKLNTQAPDSNESSHAGAHNKHRKSEKNKKEGNTLESDKISTDAKSDFLNKIRDLGTAHWITNLLKSKEHVSKYLQLLMEARGDNKFSKFFSYDSIFIEESDEPHNHPQVNGFIEERELARIQESNYDQSSNHKDNTKIGANIDLEVAKLGTNVDITQAHNAAEKMHGRNIGYVHEEKEKLFGRYRDNAKYKPPLIPILIGKLTPFKLNGLSMKQKVFLLTKYYDAYGSGRIIDCEIIASTKYDAADKTHSYNDNTDEQYSGAMQATVKGVGAKVNAAHGKKENDRSKAENDMRNYNRFSGKVEINCIPYREQEFSYSMLGEYNPNIRDLHELYLSTFDKAASLIRKLVNVYGELIDAIDQFYKFCPQIKGCDTRDLYTLMSDNKLVHFDHIDFLDFEARIRRFDTDSLSNLIFYLLEKPFSIHEDHTKNEIINIAQKLDSFVNELHSFGKVNFTEPMAKFELRMNSHRETFDSPDIFNEINDTKNILAESKDRYSVIVDFGKKGFYRSEMGLSVAFRGKHSEDNEPYEKGIESKIFKRDQANDNFDSIKRGKFRLGQLYSASNLFEFSSARSSNSETHTVKVEHVKVSIDYRYTARQNWEKILHIIEEQNLENFFMGFGFIVPHKNEKIDPVKYLTLVRNAKRRVKQQINEFHANYPPVEQVGRSQKYDQEKILLLRLSSVCNIEGLLESIIKCFNEKDYLKNPLKVYIKKATEFNFKEKVQYPNTLRIVKELLKESHSYLESNPFLEDNTHEEDEPSNSAHPVPHNQSIPEEKAEHPLVGATLVPPKEKEEANLPRLREKEKEQSQNGKNCVVSISPNSRLTLQLPSNFPDDFVRGFSNTLLAITTSGSDRTKPSSKTLQKTSSAPSKLPTTSPSPAETLGKVTTGNSNNDQSYTPLNRAN